MMTATHIKESISLGLAYMFRSLGHFSHELPTETWLHVGRQVIGKEPRLLLWIGRQQEERDGARLEL